MAAGGFLAGRIVGFMLLRIVLVGIAPWLHFRLEKCWSRAGLTTCQTRFGVYAFPLGNALNIQGMRLVVGIALGPVAVSVFATLRTLSRVGFQLVQSVSSMIEPELGLAFGKGDKSLFRQIIRRSCQIALWSTLAACLILLLAGEKTSWCLDSWPNLDGLAPLCMAVLATVINALWSTMLMAAYATNRHGWIGHSLCVYIRCWSASLAYVGAQASGLPGVGVAVALAEMGWQPTWSGRTFASVVIHGPQWLWTMIAGHLFFLCIV